MSKRSKRGNHSNKQTNSKNHNFTASDGIGAAGAEDDAVFLNSCFVDTGNLSLLQDCSDIRHIVLGRTGSGKSALLGALQKEAKKNAIEISPHSLALTYVSNSTVLNYFSELGVNLDPFFTLLWRHVVTIEILSRHFDKQHTGKSDSTMIDWVRSFFEGNSRENKRMKASIKYLEDWGKKFWLETEYRVKEITQKLEHDLVTSAKGTLGIDLAAIESNVQGRINLAEEVKGELKRHGQQIVSAAQVQDLNHVLAVLDSVLTDPQQPYFLIIDALDENWVEEGLKYKLIMALIQTARDFNKVKNAKVILALRRDVIERVFRKVRDSGFQEEKYESMYLRVKWSKDELIDILEKRLIELGNRKNAIDRFSISKVLPAKYNNLPIREYLTSRAPRPRDIISFFNCCIDSAVGKSKLTANNLRIAEGEYSRKRLRALGDEWSADYPNLLDCTKILQTRPSSFKISSIDEQDFISMCLDLASSQSEPNDALAKTAHRVIEDPSRPINSLIEVMQVFYKVGLIGLKVETFQSESWSDELGRGVSLGDINKDTSIVIHPAYHRSLGIN